MAQEHGFLRRLEVTMHLSQEEAVRVELEALLVDKVPLGTKLSIEWPGFILITYPDHGNTWAIGTANEVWGGELNWPGGGQICYFDTDLLPNADPKIVAREILRHMEEGE